MRALFTILLFCSLLFGVCFAQAPPEESAILYITKYHLSVDNAIVYGLFDMGNKPSVRLPFSNPSGGKLRLQLHGRHYLSPVGRPFSMMASFEDVTGREFEQSRSISFSPSKPTMMAQWFLGLDDVVGIYGSQSVEIKVPPGTVIINLMGDDEGNSASPNELVGYISHIQLY